ncbi:MAG: glycosyltransferase [Plesiomonas sp.]|uniref:glycosyltransferase n=1 Tax=Plesiomonas sp. TaxID=2486279 RepID=UPI003F36041D
MQKKQPKKLTSLITKGIMRNKKELPFVSVICPTYNRRSFLPTLLYMYQYQDYPINRRELIILDDSEKSNQDIIDLIDDTYGLVKYIHLNKKEKLGKKRNMLNEMSNGEYILCMDDDDYYPPNKISYTIGEMLRTGAKISGSDEMYIWYSHINKIYKTKKISDRNACNGTFCYHRDFLNTHRYCDNLSISEEKFFLNNYTTDILQLDPSKTILCVSHSDNTFDKQKIINGCTASNISIEEFVNNDENILQHYNTLSGYNRTNEVDWSFIDKIIYINLDKRKDRAERLQNELLQIGVPPEKTLRFSAFEEENGAIGCTKSHIEILKIAQEMNWKNVLILEDDIQFVKQQNTITNVNNYFNALKIIDWNVAFLSSNIFEYSPIPSCSHIIKIHKSFAACAYIINQSYYTTLINNYEESLSLLIKTEDKKRYALDSYWHSLMKKDTWISIHPNFGYQGAEFSEIEKNNVDYTNLFFKEIIKEKKLNSIAFYIENSFHYVIYKSTIEHLISQSQSCTLLINDLMEASLQNEVIDFLTSEQINEHLDIKLLSTVTNDKIKFACLASPYYMDFLNRVAEINVRYIYGQAKEKWMHDWWNIFYDKIFCQDIHSKEKLNILDSCQIIGNTKYDEFFTHGANFEKLNHLNIDKSKKTILYAPTYGELSSLNDWIVPLSQLKDKYNVIIKPHHVTLSRTSEVETKNKIAKSFNLVETRKDTSAELISISDLVLSDNSGFLFDALLFNAKFAILHTDYDNNNEFTDTSSIEQKIKSASKIIKTKDEIIELIENDSEYSLEIKSIANKHCATMNDGDAGYRAAKTIINLIENQDEIYKNHFRLSLKNKLFNNCN